MNLLAPGLSLPAYPCSGAVLTLREDASAGRALRAGLGLYTREAQLEPKPRAWLRAAMRELNAHSAYARRRTPRVRYVPGRAHVLAAGNLR